MTDNAPLILFVDDEATAVKYFQRAIDSLAPVIAAGTVEEGKRLLDEHAGTLSVLVSDQRMPGGSGNELLLYARIKYPHMVRILTTAYSELEQTVEAVNQGQIHRYIQKPWEISELRMELKQALELAALRKEHDELLREKLMVRQMQTVSHRIGSLYTLCTALGEPASALDDYLYAAAAAGITPFEPDWLLMDYSDLVGAEAYRSGRLGQDLKNRLAETRESGEPALLSELGCEKVEEKYVFSEGQNFAEFLETPADAPVSERHVSWLAFLFRLHGEGKALQLKKTASGFEGSVTASGKPVSRERIAAWIGHFCDS
ncbi:MAG TPA: response regulator [Burkholderiales bacterium]|nr:response regulator [Burkholderiales bacterium]